MYNVQSQMNRLSYRFHSYFSAIKTKVPRKTGHRAYLCVRRVWYENSYSKTYISRTFERHIAGVSRHIPWHANVPHSTRILAMDAHMPFVRNAWNQDVNRLVDPAFDKGSEQTDQWQFSKNSQSRELNSPGLVQSVESSETWGNIGTV